MLPLLLLFACAESPEEGAVDVRVPLPDLPAFGAQLLGPEVEIAPYTDVQFCAFGTYEGEDLGINVGTAFQDGAYGHHAIILLASSLMDDRPDGEVWDCSGTDSMTQALPLVVPTEPAVAGVAAMELPEGIAVKLEGGARYVVQSHYTNTTDRPLLVRDVVNLEGMPLAEVETFAALFTHTALGIDVPAQGEQTLTASCEWEDDVEILSFFGHMHEHGASFAVDGPEGRIYDVPEWDPSYRDAPPRRTFAPGELTVSAGEVWETTCSWSNPTDEVLTFPDEMCAFIGLAAPSQEPIICVD